MELSNLNIKNGLCISIGANIDSQYGTPVVSIIKLRPMIEKVIFDLINVKSKDRHLLKYIFNWSSLYKTSPIGVNIIQPDYINCLLLVKSDLMPIPSYKKAKIILQEFQNLEKEFGRNKSIEIERWQSRPLDLDILWWDNIYINEEDLKIPHPRFKDRNFVISPLSEVLSRSQKLEKLNTEEWPID